jgi:hypothetical protein
VGARAYDPRTARWLQRDPIDAASGDPNLYRYCGNDPVNFADPSGLAPEWVHGGLDLAGWIPGIGEVADLINAGLYALEGDWVNAGISALGIIPGLGDAAKAGRMGKRAKDLAEKWLPSNALYNRGGSKAPRLFRPTSSNCPNPWGRHGSPAHRAKVAQVENDLIQQGYTIQSSQNTGGETRVSTQGGVKPYRYPDIVAIDPLGNIWYIQIGRLDKRGIPVKREIEALSDLIRTVNPVKFYPYP